MIDVFIPTPMLVISSRPGYPYLEQKMVYTYKTLPSLYPVYLTHQ